jgi:hypothetical protein
MAARRQPKAEPGKALHRLVDAIAHIDNDMIENR